MSDEQFMQQAMAICLEGIEAGQTPFGAVIVRDDKVLAAAHNRVWLNHDATAHAEVNAIRMAGESLGHPLLEGATLYSTAEPCPMCFSAIHWARIQRVVFGARIEDVQRYAFHELPITNQQMRQLGKSDIEIVPDFMRDRCIELFERWQSLGESKPY